MSFFVSKELKRLPTAASIADADSLYGEVGGRVMKVSKSAVAGAAGVVQTATITLDQPGDAEGPRSLFRG